MSKSVAAQKPAFQPSVPVPVQAAKPVEADKLHAITRALEDSEAAPKLAVLIRLSEGLAVEDSGGSEPALDNLFWRGVELLSRDVLHDLERLQQIADTHRVFVTIADTPGGAQ